MIPLQQNPALMTVYGNRRSTLTREILLFLCFFFLLFEAGVSMSTTLLMQSEPNRTDLRAIR